MNQDAASAHADSEGVAARAQWLVVLTDFNEDAFTGTLGGRRDHARLGRRRDKGQFVGAARIVKDLGPFEAIRDAIFQDRKDLGCVIGADPVAGAEVLIDPNGDAGMLVHRDQRVSHFTT